MVDEALIAQCRAGNAAAFRLLYYRTMPRVRAWVTRLLGSRAAVADVVQEVFIHVHRSIGTYRGDAAFETWLYRLTLNVATSSLRRAGRDLSVIDAERSAEPLSYQEENRFVARDELRCLYRALDALPVDNRVAFVLYELEGLTLREISDLAGTGIPTVAARLRRARCSLAETIGLDFLSRRLPGLEQPS